jgi:hypothetical protein
MCDVVEERAEGVSMCVGFEEDWLVDGSGSVD